MQRKSREGKSVSCWVTFEKTSAAPCDAFRTSHKPAKTMILSWKVQDPLLALVPLLVCVLLMAPDGLPTALPSTLSIEEEIEVEREEEEGASGGIREDFCGVASTDRAHSSLLALGLLSARTSNWGTDGEREERRGGDRTDGEERRGRKGRGEGWSEDDVGLKTMRLIEI
jgi:hypothetical protein